MRPAEDWRYKAPEQLPPVVGGQGRSDADVFGDGLVVACCVVAVAAVAAVLFLRWVLL